VASAAYGDCFTCRVLAAVPRQIAGIGRAVVFAANIAPYISRRNVRLILWLLADRQHALADKRQSRQQGDEFSSVNHAGTRGKALNCCLSIVSEWRASLDTNCFPFTPTTARREKSLMIGIFFLV